jgi:uncharacterized membrane protein
LLTMILSGIGLAAGSGLNAYLPLLVLALADRFTDFIDLGAPFNIISSFWGMLVLLLVLPLELIPDKIPKFDHMSDLVHSAVRPALSAFAFMAVASQVEDFQMVFGFILGLVIAGAVTWVKIMSRPGITETTNGLGNPIVSLLEDALAMVFAIVGVLLPYGVIAVVPLGLLLLFRTYRRMQSGESRLVSAFRPSGTTQPGKS